MDGIIQVRKPPLVTSHDVVKQVRILLPGNKVGHFGTLDPLATGLLLVAVGSTTRLFPFYSKLDKAYSGEIRLGQSMDTYDSTGKPTSSPSTRWPGRQELEQAMRCFEGEMSQLAPPFSAKKHKGRPLYELARANQPTPLIPSLVTVHSFQCLSFNAPDIEFSVRCSSGTYIRSLAHDLGQQLECGAHLTRLVRTAIGRFSLEGALSLEEISELSASGNTGDFLIPIEELLPEFPKLILSEEGTALARNGNLIAPQHIAGILEDGASGGPGDDPEAAVFRLFSQEGRLLAFARRASGQSGLHPFLVVDTGTANQ
jgi:tRNA pseudouridine55 synthase